MAMFLVGIAAVVSIIRKFEILCIWFENTYLCPQNGGFDSINGEQCQHNPQKKHPCTERHQMTFKSSKSFHWWRLGMSQSVKKVYSETANV